MNNVRLKSFPCGYLLFLMIHAGCAQKLTVPPADATIPQFGEVAIVPARFAPDYNFDTFAIGLFERAGEDIVEGALGGLSGSLFLAGLDPIAILLLPVFVTGGAVVGGVHGVMNSVPDEKAQQIGLIIHRAVRELDIQNTLAQHVLTASVVQNEVRFHLHPEYGSFSTDISDIEYRVKQHQIDAILELTVLEVGFEEGMGIDPSASLAMIVRVRLIRLLDGKAVYSNRFEYHGPNRTLVSWAENDARLLRNEFIRCYRDIAERIVKTIFLTSTACPSGILGGESF